MFSDKLFDHKYDIDALIGAFCGDVHSKYWCLNTRNGDIYPVQSAADVDDGGDNNHIHLIESLPFSFIDELKCNAKFKKLEVRSQADVLNILENVLSVHDLTDYFDKGDAGSYLIKSVKAACLDWLDVRNLIPPSMRHTSDMSMFDSFVEKGQKVKVSIK